MTKIIAHRGYASKYPENTKSAFESAYQEQADGIEIDVHLSKDGEVVICHDDRIDRTSNGSGFIYEYNLEQLKGFDFAANFESNDEYQKKAEEKIMTLQEYFEWAKDKDLITNIELKTSTVKNDGIEEMVNKIIVNYQQERSVIISSFNHKSILKMKKENPGISCGFLTMHNLLDPEQYCRKYSVEYYHPNHLMIDEELVKNCKNSNTGLNIWTLNDAESIKEMLPLGLTSIITDDPKMAVKVVKSHKL